MVNSMEQALMGETFTTIELYNKDMSPQRKVRFGSAHSP